MRWILNIFIFNIVLIIVSCNSKVFIDEFLQDSSPVSVTEEKGDVMLKFRADNWDILGIGNINSDFHVEAMDLEGNSKELPFKNGETGIVRCHNDFFDFSIEKRLGDELKFTLWENLYDSPVGISVKVGNQYEQKDIEVKVGIMQKYRIDSVVYDWEKWDLYTIGIVLVDSLVADNSKGISPLAVTFYPYKNAVRHIKLSSSNGLWENFKEECRRCLGMPLPQITVPDLKDGHPVSGSTTITFGLEEQQLAVDLDKNLKAEKNVVAGDIRKLMIYNGLDRYSVPYKVYVSHPKTGRQRIFEGILQSECPRDYLVVSEKIIR